MKTINKNLFRTLVLSVTAAAALIACGGGGDTATPPAAIGPIDTVVIADPITSVSNAVATSIGATPIAGASSDEEVYDLVADIGDTWQLVLNNRTNTYVIKVLRTQFGLTSTTAAAFTRTIAGNIITITGPAGNNLSVQIDIRTKTVGGNARVGLRNATLAGTGYTVASTALLAGNYFFLGATRNVSNGGFADNPAGSFIVAPNGTDITVCDGGIVVNNACAVVPNSGSPAVNSKLLKVSKDSVTGLLMVKDGVRDFGILHVSAGDRGPVLMLDRFGVNDDGILRTGVIFAGKAVKLAGTEFNGNFICSINGIDSAAVAVTGTTYSGKNLERNINFSGTLIYNKVFSYNGLTAVDLDGAAIAQNTGEALSLASGVLPLSSSLAVLSNRDGTLDICRRAS